MPVESWGLEWFGNAGSGCCRPQSSYGTWSQRVDPRLLHGFGLTYWSLISWCPPQWCLLVYNLLRYIYICIYIWYIYNIDHIYILYIYMYTINHRNHLAMPKWSQMVFVMAIVMESCSQVEVLFHQPLLQHARPRLKMTYCQRYKA